MVVQKFLPKSQFSLKNLYRFLMGSGVFVVLFLNSTNLWALTFQDYSKKPSLVVVLVIDQFRSDYLQKFASDFVPKNKNGQVGGFRFLMEEGAYFPVVEYDVLQNMTCPGHAMISTGALPVSNGILLNDWYDRETQKSTYCVEDLEFGLSPKKLRTTTFSDELKSAYKESRVFSLALKDRAAIMLGGLRPDLTLWFNKKAAAWETSPYYRKELPAWLIEFNKQVATSAHLSKDLAQRAEQISQGEGVKLSFSLAREILTTEKLGKTKGVTDVLLLSLSSHDLSGHTYGPDSREMKDLTLLEDKEISQFLTDLKKYKGSLKDITFVLTADHGAAPNVEPLLAAHLDAGKIDIQEVEKSLGVHLDKKFGKANWLIANNTFNLYLNPEVIKEKKLNLYEVEFAAKDLLIKFPGVSEVLLGEDLRQSIRPAGMLGEQALKQFSLNISGDIILIPKPFYFDHSHLASNHLTGYFYDRAVPLIFYGEAIKKGVYATQARILDVAPTLSFILKSLASPKTDGRVLSEIFKN